MDKDLAGRVTPLLDAAGLELYDLEVAKGAIRVTLTRPGGIDLDALTAANAALSAWLDEHDVMDGPYTLEVSSPGLERRLRTPVHFKGAVGEVVTLRIAAPDAPAVRVTGTLTRADDDSITVEADGTARTATYDEIERARTVFEWGAAQKPSPSRGTPQAAGARSDKRG